MNSYFPHKLVPGIAPAPCPTGPIRFSVTVSTNAGLYTLVDPRATRALLACMDTACGLQGAASHWGGPSAFAEMASALYGLVFKKPDPYRPKEWFERFNVVNDAGHCENGLYALKANYGFAGLGIKDLKKFRSIESFLTGHGEICLFPQGGGLSNGPLGSTLAQAQGLAMADKLTGNDRMTVALVSDGACMEGEAKEALTAIPGLAQKKLLNPFLMLVSYNNTKLSGRIDQDSFSIKPYLESLSVCGWESRFIPDAHSLPDILEDIYKAKEQALSNPAKPCALIFQTVKGFGLKKTERDPTGGHGWPLSDPAELPDFIQEIYEGEEPPKEIQKWCRELQSSAKPKKAFVKKASPGAPSEKIQKGVSKALLEQKQKGVPLISISADLQGSTGAGAFHKAFPEHSFDMGVAESNMIGVGAGFSKQGFVPVVDSFAQFAVTKGALPLIMSALSRSPVIGLFSHAGFQPAGDGASHQALSYFAKTCSLPETEVYALSCSEEAYHLVSQAIDRLYKEKQEGGRQAKSRLFFFGRETFPPSLGAKSYQLDKAQVLFDGSDKGSAVLVVAWGSLACEALQAARGLYKKGQAVVVINSPCVSHPDIGAIAKYLDKCEGRLLTVEEHQAQGGAASRLVLALTEKAVKIRRFKALAVRGVFGRSAYRAGHLYKMFGLDQSSIEKAVLSLSK